MFRRLNLPTSKVEVTLFVSALIISFLPLFVSLANTPPGYQPNVNTQYYDMADTFTYFANVRLGMDGEWLYRFKFYPPTSRNQIVVHLPQILMGQLIKIASLPLSSYYQAAFGYILLVVITDVFLFLCLLYFLKVMILDKRSRLLVLLFFFFAVGVYPPNFPGLYPSMSLLFATTVADAALTLLVISFFYQRLILKNGYKKALTLSLLGLALIHPYTFAIELILISLVISFLFFARKIRLSFALETVACTLPAILISAYYFYAFYIKDFLGWVQTHNELADFFKTPSLLELLLIYNLQFIFVGYFVYKVVKKPNPKGVFLLAWFMTQLILSYSPIGAQKVLVKGLGISTAVISGIAAGELLLLVSKKRREMLIPFISVIVVLCFQGYFTSTLVPLSRALQTTTPSSYIYSPKSHFEALNFLNKLEKNKKHAVIAEDESIGRLIPAATGLTSFNGYVTPHLGERTKQAALFFEGEMTNAEAQKFMGDNYLKYVIVKKEADGLNYSPLQKIYENGSLRIYLNSNKGE